MAGMTLQEAFEKGKEQYAGMIQEEQQLAGRLQQLRETILRQEGYLTALSQVVEGVENNGSEEVTTQEVDSEGGDFHEEAGNNGKFTQSTGRSSGRANPRREVGASAS